MRTEQDILSELVYLNNEKANLLKELFLNGENNQDTAMKLIDNRERISLLQQELQQQQ